NVVIATGGGTLMAESSMALALDMSTVLWLKAEADVLYQRVSQSHKTHRPILRMDDAEHKFHELFEARESFYAQSHIAVYTDRVSSSHHFPVDQLVDVLQLPKVALPPATHAKKSGHTRQPAGQHRSFTPRKPSF
ncbi:MAG: shikimate kinase, partial [Vampirovibrionales bacterium]